MISLSMPVAYCIIAHINQSLIIPQRLRVALHGVEPHLADMILESIHLGFIHGFNTQVLESGLHPACPYGANQRRISL
jgi:hypothetical protein